MLRKEHPVPSWEAAVAEDWLGKWAVNQMLINVATRKFARSVRLPGGDVPAPPGAGLTKSAVARRFVALSTARMKEWMASDLSSLDLLVIQIDGIHMDEDLILVAAPSATCSRAAPARARANDQRLPPVLSNSAIAMRRP
jgi:putative transposase